jgi:hypothetical protein
MLADPRVGRFHFMPVVFELLAGKYGAKSGKTKMVRATQS